MELFAKIVHLDVWLGSEKASTQKQPPEVFLFWEYAAHS